MDCSFLFKEVSFSLVKMCDGGDCDGGDCDGGNCDGGDCAGGD